MNENPYAAPQTLSEPDVPRAIYRLFCVGSILGSVAYGFMALDAETSHAPSEGARWFVVCMLWAMSIGFANLAVVHGLKSLLYPDTTQ